MEEIEGEKLEEIQKLARERKIEFAPNYEISDFCYKFVQKITRIKPVFLSNESSLLDFPIDEEPEPEDLNKYWFSRINEIYSIDLSDMEIENLNIAKICSELEKRLEWERI